MKRLTLLTAVIVLLCGCTLNNTIQLNGTEISDYQGEQLSSINDFRENSIKGPQYVDINNYSLEILGLVNTSIVYTYDEVLSFQSYEKIVQLDCVEGWSVKLLWTGVLVKDLISSAGVLPEANTVIFYAYDGYSTSFPISYIIDNNILLAYKINSVTLPPERGYPFQLVAEDKWGYKWIKWVTKIAVSDDESYEGYWESRGYNNNGSITGSKFD